MSIDTLPIGCIIKCTYHKEFTIEGKVLEIRERCIYLELTKDCTIGIKRNRIPHRPYIKRKGTIRHFGRKRITNIEIINQCTQER